MARAPKPAETVTTTVDPSLPDHTPADLRFAASLPLVLVHEAGYVNDPRDPGGATNLGISLRYAKTRGSIFDLDGDGDVDADDIREITVETAGPAYRVDFWNTVGADFLPPGADYSLFDFAVNSGPDRAVRVLQRVVGASVDGNFGPETRAAVAATDPMVLIEGICTQRLVFLRRLPGWGNYGHGWGRRVAKVMEQSHRMALGMPL